MDPRGNRGQIVQGYVAIIRALVFTPSEMGAFEGLGTEEGHDLTLAFRAPLCLCLPSRTPLTGAQEGAAEWRHTRLPDRLQGEQPWQQRAVQHRGDEGHWGQRGLHPGQPQEVRPVWGGGPGLQSGRHRALIQ